MQNPVKFHHLKQVIPHIILFFLSKSQYRSQLFELEQHAPLQSHACNHQIQKWAGLDKCDGLCIVFQVLQLWPKNKLVSFDQILEAEANYLSCMMHLLILTLAVKMSEQFFHVSLIHKLQQRTVSMLTTDT